MTETEKKIEVIRFSCAHGYAEGFEYHQETINSEEYIRYPGGYCSPDWFLDDPLAWPLFLQRTIEGINRNRFEVGWVINQFGGQLLCASYKEQDETEKYFTHSSGEEDQAKLAAIIYVMEHSEEKV